MDKTCGHIELTIDGHKCDAPGTVWNATGTASPIVAKLALCPMSTGLHAVELALKDDVPVCGRTAASIVVMVP